MITDFKRIQRVTLKLGNLCNMSCRHCSQNNDKALIISNELSPIIVEFLDNYIQFAINDTNKIHRSLTFYGGEPLLYWDLIKDIVIHFTEKYDLLHKDLFSFCITSNGLALTKEKVEFLNRYKIRFRFSYDAPYPFAVRGFVSDTICDLVNQINDCVILAGGSSYNCDPVLTHRCLQAKFPNAKQNIRLGVSRMFTGMEDDIDTYDFNHLSYAIRKLFISAKLGDTFSLRFIKNQIENVYYHWNEKLGIGVGQCTPAFIRLTVDLNGNVYFCSNACNVVGTVTDSLETIFEQGKQYWNGLLKVCEMCEHKDLCSDVCCLSIKNENGIPIDCIRFKKPFWKIFKQELKNITVEVTDEERKWFEEQEAIMNYEVQMFLMKGKEFLYDR